MTKSELINRLREKNRGLVLEDIAVSVEAILDAIRSSLVSGGRVEIRGFGVFCTSMRPSRMSRNPKTNEPVWVPEKRVPAFKAGKELRAAVDRKSVALDFSN